MNATSHVLEMPSAASMERHYSVAQVAAQWGLSEDTVRRLFEHEPGVLVIEPPRGRYSRRRYRTLRIPESVIARVHRTHLVVTGGR
jgi:AraC-like DNA-binding protein